jgi:hypothetical protein
MKQVPGETSVTMFGDDRVQTGVVAEMKLTVRPEEAVAVSVTVPLPSATLLKGLKVMV